ncbi:STAS domain-containing protein [Streptomyces sp. NBC_00377]|uniref:STAS domain-containing protein n=1 Tax=unclassified Streptomyces TaxID=2593676 RepID=UPI002E21B26D|nr:MULTISPECIES: STAS domain-containing protein [unclassified Streptomyces]
MQYEREAAWVVVAHGDYDTTSIAPLEEALDTTAPKHSRVVIDASGVSFADSTSLNLLLRIHHLTSLRVAGPPRHLRRLFGITGADTVLDTRENIQNALT